jgi:hypothetical protein
VKSAAASAAVRRKKNGVFSQAALTGIGLSTHGYSTSRPKNSTSRSTKATGRKPTVVTARRRTLGDQRASVSCIIAATAGPVTASPDQNTRFTR